MLKLYNTMTRSTETFEPRDGGEEVKIFTCGPSIYRRPHIGNYRTFLYEDILVRYLEYLGFRVNRVINFTDVEDKALREAEERGKDVGEITRNAARHFYDETATLGIKLPPSIPSSSTSVDEAAEIIRVLLEKGHAYRHRGDVFFDPLTFEGFGKLFRLDMSKWPRKKVRFRKDTYTGNRWNLGDFILWHGHRNGDPAVWDTVIGRGRPSWNVQDPAMILKHLGEQVDINCGGIDNIYRHHDYNIAIMEALSGKEYARFYLHGAHLIVDGTTMSKSRGNILHPEDVIGQEVSPHHLRFFLISTYYRKRLNFTERNLKRSMRELDDLRADAARLVGRPASARAAYGTAGEADDGATRARRSAVPREAAGAPTQELISGLTEVFEERMNDDLRLGEAAGRVRGLTAELVRRKQRGQVGPEETGGIEEALRRIDSVMGVIFAE